jgi:glycosyltransferase involved in cell wall biosynthesis
MACGVPVIISRVSSLPEVGGDAALYVDPHDPGSIARAILTLAGDRELAARLATAGRERAARFRWDEAARATSAVFRRAAGLESGCDDAYRV